MMDWATAAKHVAAGEIEPMMVAVRGGFDLNATDTGEAAGTSLLHIVRHRARADWACGITLGRRLWRTGRLRCCSTCC